MESTLRKKAGLRSPRHNPYVRKTRRPHMTSSDGSGNTAARVKCCAPLSNTALGTGLSVDTDLTSQKRSVCASDEDMCMIDASTGHNPPMSSSLASCRTNVPADAQIATVANSDVMPTLRAFADLLMTEETISSIFNAWRSRMDNRTPSRDALLDTVRMLCSDPFSLTIYIYTTSAMGRHSVFEQTTTGYMYLFGANSFKVPFTCLSQQCIMIVASICAHANRFFEAVDENQLRGGMECRRFIYNGTLTDLIDRTLLLKRFMEIHIIRSQSSLTARDELVSITSSVMYEKERTHAVLHRCQAMLLQEDFIDKVRDAHIVAETAASMYRKEEFAKMLNAPAPSCTSQQTTTRLIRLLEEVD